MALFDFKEGHYLVAALLLGIPILTASCRPQQPAATQQRTARLEFRVAVGTDDLPSEQITLLRRRLAEGAQSFRSSVGSLEFGWFPIWDVNTWSPIDNRPLFDEAPAKYLAQHFGVVAGDSDGRIYLLLRTDKPAVMTQSDDAPWAVASAYWDHDRLGNAVPGFQLDEKGTRELALLTTGCVGQRLAIIINGEVYATPLVSRKVDDGKAVIPGVFVEGQILRMIRMLE